MCRKINLLVLALITLFMGYCFLFTPRSASEIATIGIVMAFLNSGVPTSLMLDKLIELKKSK